MSTREVLLEFDKEKKTIEQSIEEQWMILRSNNIGMSEALVDAEDYPRNDIDVHAVRNARQKIRCLQNDHRSIMSKIEIALEELHNDIRTQQIDPNGTNVPDDLLQLNPFAKVSEVVFGSPAQLGGILLEDRILKFGSVTMDNFRNMQSIAEVVRNSENTSVQVIVKREENNKTLSITPKRWTGLGLLGCKIVPIDHLDR